MQPPGNPHATATASTSTTTAAYSEHATTPPATMAAASSEHAAASTFRLQAVAGRLRCRSLGPFNNICGAPTKMKRKKRQMRAARSYHIVP
jgi:hypothetical protein